MTGDKRIQNGPWQGRIAVLLLILAIIAVPAVALGADLASNTTEPTVGIPDEISPSVDVEDNGTPEPTLTEMVEEEVTLAAIEQLPQYIDIDTTPGIYAVIPSNNNVLLQISNDGNARFNDYGNNTYHFFSPDQNAGQGMNALHITIDPAESSGQVTFSSDQAGVFYLTDTGGRGWDDDGILMLAVNGTIPDSFRVNIKASGYQWTPVPENAKPAFDDIIYVSEALNETFTKDDFLYGPQIWRPCAAANYPIFDGQDMADTENTFSILFIDLNAGILGVNTLSQPSFSGQSVTDNGAIKVEYSFENLPTLAAFDAYAYTVSSNQGQGIRWTNCLSTSGSSGYAVIGQPLPEAPIADFTASATSGAVPFFVRFNDTSTNSPTAWEWDFGDGATSTAQNATHTYMAAGTYSVNLTVTNEAGTDSKIKQDYITVGETPSGKGLADTAWPKFGYDLQNTGQSPYLGPQTATIKWTYTISIEDPAGQPAIGSDGTIYIECIDRHLYALNPDGTPKWNFTAGDRLYGSPAIGKDGTIYIGSTDKNLYAINPDGTLKWTYTTDSSISESSATIAPDGTIYIGTTGYQKNTLHAISDDGTQGTTKWTFNAGQLYSTPAVGTDGTIYIGSLDKNLYALNPDGTLKWTYTTGGKMQRTSPSIGTDGTIYIGNADNNLYAINPDGTLKWTYTFGSYIYSSVAIGSDGTIYTGNNDKKVYAINPDGTLKWDFTTENMIRSTPVLGSDGTIYIGSYDRKFYALNPDGTLNWMYTTGGGINCHAAIGSDGTLYIGTTENIIYAFKDPVTPPTADFTANVTSGDAPLAVAFTDTSTGAITSWAWDFGDAATSTEQNPTYTYTTPGTYTVNLTVSNEAGSNSMVKTGYITVTELYVPQPARIVVTPPAAELAVGATQAFAATVYDTDEMAMNDAAVTWASSNETVGMVNTAGLFTARAPGTTTVTAAYANVAGTAVATVTLPKGDQTQDTPLDIPGCNVTPGDDGKSQVSINTTTTNATVNGTTIRIEEDNFTLTIETEGAPTNESGTVNGTVASIRLDTNPIVTDLASVGTVNASVSLNLTGLPQGAGLTTTVSQNVSADARSAFQLAASAGGLALGDVAYTLNIVRTNLENGQDIAGATIRMSVSPAWVAAHGGVDAIRIIRLAEDGTKEVLATTLVGTDADGNMIFEAASPKGLSAFGLAAVSAASQPAGSTSSGGGGSSTAVGAASNLKAGSSATLPMQMTAVSAVTLTAKTDIKDAMVTMAKGSLPQAAQPPAGVVYQYVQATLYKAAEADLAAVQFRFAVPTAWLAEQGCTAGQIALLQYTADGWKNVPVEALGEENGNAVFTANPDAFGLFAVAATGEAPGTTGDVTPGITSSVTPTETKDTVAHAEGTTATPKATPLPVWAAVLALGGALLLVRRP